MSAESLLTKRLIPTSAIIVALFVLLWVVVSPLTSVTEDHMQMMSESHQVLYQTKLTNHFLWAQCVNETLTITDEATRLFAQDRCIPPEEKKLDSTGDQAYLFENAPFIKTIAYRAVPTVTARGLSSGSSSSMTVYNRTVAQQNAERQRLAHLKSISGAINFPPQP